MVNWDRNILGVEFSLQVEYIAREMLLGFADLMGTTNPIYFNSHAARAQGYDDIIALPAFVLVQEVNPLLPPELDFHGMGINAGYECRFDEVIYPYDTLTFSTCLVDILFRL